jgi:hypothetical protein
MGFCIPWCCRKHQWALSYSKCSSGESKCLPWGFACCRTGRGFEIRSSGEQLENWFTSSWRLLCDGHHGSRLMSLHKSGAVVWRSSGGACPCRLHQLVANCVWANCPRRQKLSLFQVQNCVYRLTLQLTARTFTKKRPGTYLGRRGRRRSGRARTVAAEAQTAAVEGSSQCGGEGGRAGQCRLGFAGAGVRVVCVGWGRRCEGVKSVRNKPRCSRAGPTTRRMQQRPWLPTPKQVAHYHSISWFGWPVYRPGWLFFFYNL